ncbi:MAG TPA: hypothetical protein VN176_05330 [Verrucomicrobiae bacterium]|jgi:hypothetical protein|nr:hypothetical protein [Verrucomicrobiae bacterium]
MQQSNPLLITLALLVLAIVVIVIVARRRQVLAGYTDIRRDVLRLCRMLGAEPLREGDDLVLQGNYEKHPVTVRFSYSDNSPALSVTMGVPADFQLSIVPRAASARKGGRVVLRTDDAFLDSAFITSSDQPTQARLFTDNRDVKRILKALGRSSSIFLNVAPGSMTVSELALSSPAPADVIAGYLRSMVQLAVQLLAMPNASAIRIEPYRKPGSLMARVIVGVALAIGMFAAWRMSLSGSAVPLVTSSPAGPAGISPMDATAILGLKDWRLLQEADFDPTLAQWLRNQEIVPSGKIPGDFSGRANGRDVAYLLVNTDGRVRALILSQGKTVSDYAYRHLAIAARVPKSALSGITWRSELPGQPDGDGLLLVEQPDDPTSATVLFLNSGKVVRALPDDYKKISLQ